MADNEIMLKSIELLQAIGSRDLETTKELVEYFNENEDSINSFINFNQHFLEKIEANFDNEALIYAINNLKDLKDSLLQWTLIIAQLQKTNNKQNIEDFIVEYTQPEVILESYQIGSLVELCTSNNRYDLLDLIHAKLSN